MLRLFAILFGIALIFVGVAGFLPQFMTDGLLFGYFEVDSMHNLVHLVTGVLAIMAAGKASLASTFFKLFGLIYAAIAVAGFWYQGDFVMMHMNQADHILHAVIAVVALYFGFFVKRPSA